MVEDAEGWGVSEWQVAASWTVTGMVDGIDDNSFVDEENHVCQGKIRQLNRYAYKFGDVLTAPFYINFLAPVVKERTHHLGTDNRFGQFRAWFRLPLHLIESIAQQFIEEGYLHTTRRIRNNTILQAKAEIIVLSCLNVLAHGTPLHCLPLNTHILHLIIVCTS
jgi:hypothetical protein